MASEQKLTKQIKVKLLKRATEIVDDLQVFSFQISQNDNEALQELAQVLGDLATEALNEAEAVLAD